MRIWVAAGLALALNSTAFAQQGLFVAKPNCGNAPFKITEVFGPGAKRVAAYVKAKDYRGARTALNAATQFAATDNDWRIAAEFDSLLSNLTNDEARLAILTPMLSSECEAAIANYRAMIETTAR